MTAFLKETWRWILAPSVILGVFLVIYLVFLDRSPAPFVYTTY